MVGSDFQKSQKSIIEQVLWDYLRLKLDCIADLQRLNIIERQDDRIYCGLIRRKIFYNGFLVPRKESVREIPSIFHIYKSFLWQHTRGSRSDCGQGTALQEIIKMMESRYAVEEPFKEEGYVHATRSGPDTPYYMNKCKNRERKKESFALRIDHIKSD